MATKTKTANEGVVTSLTVTPKQFSNFEEVVETGKFNNGYYDHLKKDSTCKAKVLSSVDGLLEENLVLYYEGGNQTLPEGSAIYDYFAQQGLEVVENPHPSLLVNAMGQLTEENLASLGIPRYVNIVLPSAESSLFSDCNGAPCFLEAHRIDDLRELSLVDFYGEWEPYFAFLLRKKP